MNKKLDDFLKIEKQSELNNIYLNSMQIWPYIRCDIWDCIMRGIRTQEGYVKNAGDTRLSIGQLIRNVTIANPMLSHQKCTYLFVTFPQRVPNGDHYECIYTDEIANALDDTLTWEIWDRKQKHLTPALSKHIEYLDYLDVLSNLRLLLLKKYLNRSTSLCIVDVADKITNAISASFPDAIDRDLVQSLVRKRYIQYIIKRPCVEKMLKRSDPKMIFELCSQHFNNMLINEVASDLKIPTIELEHGIMNGTNLVYHHGDVDAFVKALPDYLFTFSDRFSNGCLLPKNKMKPFSTGFPFQNRMKKEFCSGRIESADEKRILVLSSPVITSMMIKIVCDITDRMEKAGCKYRVLYRLHPTESAADRSIWDEVAKNNNVQIIANNELNLYECFSESDVQIGCRSMALYEGMACGLTTYEYDDGLSIEEANELELFDRINWFKDSKELYNSLIGNTKEVRVNNCTIFNDDALNCIVNNIKILGQEVE